VGAVTELGEMTGMASLRALIPFPIEHSAKSGQEYLIESALSGTPGTAAGRFLPVDSLVDAAQAAVSQLHGSTSGWVTFDQANLDRWVSQPLHWLGQSAGVDPAVVVSLGRQLVDGLRGQLVPAARLHGNLGLGKALFDGNGRLTGLIDWEWSTVGPVFLDWCSLALSAIAVHFDEDVGRATRRALEDPEVFRTHRALAQRTLPEVELSVLVLFTWLHTIVPLLRSAPETGPGRYWLIRNVESVLGRHREPVLVGP
jgi:hypothetical protein